MNLYYIYKYIFIYLILYKQWNPVESGDPEDKGGGDSDTSGSDSPKLLALDMTELITNPNIEHSRDISNKTDIYTSTNGYLFQKITLGTSTIFEAENENYVNKLFIKTQSESDAQGPSGLPREGGDSGSDVGETKLVDRFISKINELKVALSKCHDKNDLMATQYDILNKSYFSLSENYSTLNKKFFTLDSEHKDLDSRYYDLALKYRELFETIHPPDTMYYNGFPDGWHFGDPILIKEMYDTQERIRNNTMYYNDFPDGWHSRTDPDLVKELEQQQHEAERKDMLYYNGFPDGWHTRDDPDLLKQIKEHEEDLRRKDMLYYNNFPDGWHSRISGELLKQLQDRENEREKMLLNNLMYYSGFADGWHTRASDVLVKQIQDKENEREEMLLNNLMYYDGFATGWHFEDADTVRQIEEREETLKNNLMYYDGFPDGWHSNIYVEEPMDIFEMMRKLYHKQVELSTELAIIQNQYSQLRKEYNQLSADHTQLTENYTTLSQKYDQLTGMYYTLDQLAGFGEFDEFEEDMDENGSPRFKKVQPGDAADMYRAKVRSKVKEILEKYSTKSKTDGTHKIERKGVTLPVIEYPKEIKFYKSDGESFVDLTDNDFAVKENLGDIEYTFNDGVKCTKVMWEYKDVWKQGEQGIDVPSSVRFNELNELISIKDSKQFVIYKKDKQDDWKFTQSRAITSETPVRSISGTLFDSEVSSMYPDGYSYTSLFPLTDYERSASSSGSEGTSGAPQPSDTLKESPSKPAPTDTQTKSEPSKESKSPEPTKTPTTPESPKETKTSPPAPTPSTPKPPTPSGPGPTSTPLAADESDSSSEDASGGGLRGSPSGSGTKIVRM